MQQRRSVDALPQGTEPVEAEIAELVDRIDNRYWPMSPGSRWVYRETGADGTEQRVVVTVTDRTRQILGIDAVVVHDVVTEDGEVKEDTLDWYAQDADGNVWYLGEHTAEYENGEGRPPPEGSWEAGVGGAQAGHRHCPRSRGPELSYRQEYLEGEAQDAGRDSRRRRDQSRSPSAASNDVVLTKEFTR